MKIKYAFLDGTVTEVEVSDEIGAVIIDSRKAEHAQDERHRYHCYSYDAIDYEGEEYGACDEYAVEDDSASSTARSVVIAVRFSPSAIPDRQPFPALCPAPPFGCAVCSLASWHARLLSVLALLPQCGTTEDAILMSGGIYPPIL